ncbi:MAG: hypothetical protein J2P21_18890 [Chloracidobacterium sp.]|nr:hypothetical protein [Chloracidobacterium sp.]
MAGSKNEGLTPLELEIMGVLWESGANGVEGAPAQQEERERNEARGARLKVQAEIDERRRTEQEAQATRPGARTIKLNAVDGEGR